MSPSPDTTFETFFSTAEPSTLLRRVTSRAEADAAAASGNLWMAGEPISDTEVDDMTFGMAPDQYCVPADFDAPTATENQATEVVRLRAENARLVALLPDAKYLAQLARGSSWPGEMADRVERAADRVMTFSLD